MGDLRCITLHQPYAGLAAHGIKRFETRSWATSWRGPVAIHAGKTDVGMVGPYGRGMYGDADALWKLPNDGFLGERLHDPRRYEDVFEVIGSAPLGAVVAVADLTDCTPIVEEDDIEIDVSATGGAVVVNDAGSELTLWAYDGGHHPGGDPWDEHDISDQLPYGHWEPGNWALRLENVRRLAEPIAAKGKQGLWTPGADLGAALAALPETTQ